MILAFYCCAQRRLYEIAFSNHYLCGFICFPVGCSLTVQCVALPASPASQHKAVIYHPNGKDNRNRSPVGSQGILRTKKIIGGSDQASQNKNDWQFFQHYLLIVLMDGGSSNSYVMFRWIALKVAFCALIRRHVHPMTNENIPITSVCGQNPPVGFIPVVSTTLSNRPG